MGVEPGEPDERFESGGPDERFESAYRDCWTPVFRLAIAWTNDWGGAEELAQEAFTRLWERRERINWDDDPLPWLLVVTRRLATDRFRRLRTAFLAHPPRTIGFDVATHVRWLDVRDAFGRLSSLERAALAMTAVNGYSYDDAARVLGASPGAVRAAVSRARAKLREVD
jgi:RNA polymerase sigma-70 factor, ECF subfamily